MQAAAIVRPHGRGAKTCRFAAPGRRRARTQTHLVIRRGSEPRNDARELARRANSCRRRGRHPRPQEGDPLLVSARIIGDLRNVVKHKMHGRKLERVGTSLASYNILISLRNTVPSKTGDGRRPTRGPASKKPRSTTILSKVTYILQWVRLHSYTANTVRYGPGPQGGETRARMCAQGKLRPGRSH